MASPPRDPLTEALALLAELALRGEPLSVSVQRGGITATLSVRAEGGQEPKGHGAGLGESSPTEEPPPLLSPKEEEVLGVLAKAETPIKLTTLAHRMGTLNSSYLRSCLRRLCDLGLVVRCPDSKYALARREAPGQRT